jgi:hypothetical protein
MTAARLGDTKAEAQAPVVDALGLLERLGTLRDSGVLTDEEFNSKKAEILKA